MNFYFPLMLLTISLISSLLLSVHVPLHSLSICSLHTLVPQLKWKELDRIVQKKIKIETQDKGTDNGIQCLNNCIASAWPLSCTKKKEFHLRHTLYWTALGQSDCSLPTREENHKNAALKLVFPFSNKSNNLLCIPLTWFLLPFLFLHAYYYFFFCLSYE